MQRIPEPPARAGVGLEVTPHWHAYENAVIMAVLLLVIGVMLIGKGIGGF